MGLSPCEWKESLICGAHTPVREIRRNHQRLRTDGGPLKPAFGLSGNPDWLSKPQQYTLADAIKSLKQGVARRLIGDAEHFWQKRYYDFNIRDYAQFVEKLRYIHRNRGPQRARFWLAGVGVR
jgi:hypothetical protein